MYNMWNSEKFLTKQLDHGIQTQEVTNADPKSKKVTTWVIPGVGIVF